MLKEIQDCFISEKYLYSKHAKDEMEREEFGEITENEVYEAILRGKIIESYPDDDPYPSCLIYGRTSKNRPLHIVCAYSNNEGLAIVVTVYEPDPKKWEGFERRAT